MRIFGWKRTKRIHSSFDGSVVISIRQEKLKKPYFMEFFAILSSQGWFGRKPAVSA
jgi:hypothetical protein